MNYIEKPNRVEANKFIGDDEFIKWSSGVKVKIEEEPVAIITTMWGNYLIVRYGEWLLKGSDYMQVMVDSEFRKRYTRDAEV